MTAPTYRFVELDEGVVVNLEEIRAVVSAGPQATVVYYAGIENYREIDRPLAEVLDRMDAGAGWSSERVDRMPREPT